jgi:hypothetical protein
VEAALTEVKPKVNGAAVGLVALAPGGDKLAYARLAPTQATIEVASLDGDAPLRLDVLPYPPRVLAWSPDGEHLAWLSGGPVDHVGGNRVGFCAAHAPETAHTVRGNAVAWLSNDALVIADAAAGELAVLDPRGQRRRALPLSDDGHGGYRPRIARARDGRIAYTSRRAEDDMSAVWIAEGDHAELVTEVPGARCWVLPFFSPTDLFGLLLIHPRFETSAIVLIDDVASDDGRVIYRSALRDLPETPVWCDAGIVFLRSSEPRAAGASVGPPVLTRLDPESQQLEPLCEPAALSGAIHAFSDEALLVDAQRAAWRLSWR